MVTTPIRNNIKWMTPAPFWSVQGSWIRLPRQAHGLQPCILRFANDNFIEELLAMLNHAPWRLSEWLAQNETWRKPMPSPQPIVKSRPERKISGDYNKTRSLFQRHSKKEKGQYIRQAAKMPTSLSGNISRDPIKLYQAAHQRHYLVTASLVKEESGYPDYLPDISNNEKTTFIVRALVRKDNKENEYDEYAYVITSMGMAWRRVGKHESYGQVVQRLIPNEEQLPVFPVVYSNVCGRHRQIMGGLIPVVKRDEWFSAPAYSQQMDESEIVNFVPTNEGGINHYREVFYNDVIGPWKALIEQAATVQENTNVSGNPFPNFSYDESKAELDKKRVLRNTRDEIQTGSWYVLLDLALYIKRHFPNIWKVLNNELPEKTLDYRERNFLSLLRSTRIDHDLFLDLAIENLAVGGFFSDDNKSLWTRLVEIWKVELYLQLAYSLKKSHDYTEDILDWIENHEEWPELYRHHYKEIFKNYFRQSNSVPNHSLLEIIEHIKSHNNSIVEHAKDGHGSLSSFEKYLVDFLKETQFTHKIATLLSSIEERYEGTIEISDSLWGLVSLFWKIEDYFNRNVVSEVFDRLSEYIYDSDILYKIEINEHALEYFYKDQYGESWYTFLDFARDLKKIVPEIQAEVFFEAFHGTQTRDENSELGRIIKRLDEEIITAAVNKAFYYDNANGRKIRFIHTLAEALVEIEKWEKRLDEVDSPYDRTIEPDSEIRGIDKKWPDFLFPLADPSPGLDPKTGILPLARTTVPPIITNEISELHGAERIMKQLDAFADLADALTPKRAGHTAETSDINFQPFLDQSDEENPKVRFVTRFVFERPHCGKLFPAEISMASCQLLMARFFDPDAPARPVRITMPLDITPAGLRKYKKNAGFLISDMLCGKIKKIKKLTLADLVLSVLPWPFHKDLPNIGKTGPCRSKGATLGMFCSLSIPIVTLCALILLFVMVNLFNIFFKWIPYLFICFPLPGLKGKK